MRDEGMHIPIYVSSWWLFSSSKNLSQRRGWVVDKSQPGTCEP
jgi:hypothetical protein